MRVVSRTANQVAEPAVPADRCAHEIIGIFDSLSQRWRRLMRLAQAHDFGGRAPVLTLHHRPGVATVLDTAPAEREHSPAAKKDRRPFLALGLIIVGVFAFLMYFSGDWFQ